MVKKIILILVPFIIVALLAGTLGAYTNYKKLPAYSVKFIRSTIPDHNWEGFREYVDVDGIVEAAAGELLEEKMAQMEKDTGAYSMKQMSDAYEQEVKPEFIRVMTKGFEDYISRGRIKFPEGKELSDTERLLKNYMVNSMQIVSISKPSVSNGEGSFLIEFANPELKTSFEMEAKIAQQDNGMWKITGISGWKACAKAIDKAMKARLDRLNSPIRQKMQDIMDIKEISAEIGPRDEYGFSETLRIRIKADIKSDEPLSAIIGRVNIEVPDGEDTFAPFEVDMNFRPQGLQTVEVEKVLNPFVRSDVKIMRNGLTRRAFHGEITGVVFKNGKRLELLTSLPD